MAFNMYYKNGMIRKIRCHIPDKLIPTLYQIHDNSKFPQMTWLIDNLYDNPRISPDIAKQLADEMVAFEKLILSLRLPFPRVPLQKVHDFFAKAANEEQTIYSTSD